ncbi:MspA family porin [Nocardia aurantia]|uniref:Uncharacterized protein n=1 Tax=Nocardia aurantia TaxID=2585199 RepID=A0A7K0DV64_9NOCA|nr:MspA family porin [Nocardia aurantia]MQY29407.1 hypothetical protein [Nocardia aurantia]
MRRALVVVAAPAAASMLVLGVGAGPGSGRAQAPGAEIFGTGIHLTAAVDSIGVNPPGDRTPNPMPFSHAVQTSGTYSVTVSGDRITSGQAVAGFILGCAVNLANGFPVGLEPNQGLSLGFAPTFDTPADGTAPTVTLGPAVVGILGLTEDLMVTLAPGQVTVATSVTANLDDKTTFPYHITFNNSALNVAQCVTPVSAVPFVTTTVSNSQGTVQTTAYSDQFVF